MGKILSDTNKEAIMPRIITHGEVIKFICHVCGCVFLNSEDECSREFVGNDEKRIQYYSYCLECKRIEGNAK